MTIKMRRGSWKSILVKTQDLKKLIKYSIPVYCEDKAY